MNVGNIERQIFTENDYSLNEIIINVSYEPIKSDYYKKMFEHITEKKKEEEKVKEKEKVKVNSNYFSKCTE